MPTLLPFPLVPLVAAWLGTLAVSVQAQSSASTPDTATLQTVHVRSAAGAPSLQALPTSASVLDAQDLRAAQLQVNLSEGLGSVPGLQIKNRQNYAQDLQLSVRGYGARSTFGLRGVRLYVDGIPATMPDGQGSLSHIDIGSLERVEVLRGPYSALYGNSAGGVVSMFTETPEGAPFVEGSLSAGSRGQRRMAAKAGGQTAQGLSYVLSASRFMTDGSRDHSSADRNLANAKLHSAIGADAQLTLVANTMQSDAQDPQGLTWSQYQNDPRQASAVAQAYNTRKSLQQTQVGATYERHLDATHSLALTAYAGHRSMLQYQSIPPAAQNAPGHAGGVIDMSRDYLGLDARWSGRFAQAPVPVTVTAGVALDRVQEDRKGYENFVGPQLGVAGALRRDERNTITNADPYVQASWTLAPRWTLDTGLRWSRVKFAVDDAYITGPANPDDSGQVRHDRWLPVVALAHTVTPRDTFYASLGRGFETPTLAEMSYTPNGSGMHLQLQPSASTQYELGWRQRMAGGLPGQWSAALFQSDTRNEIVSAGSSGGRTTYRNAGATRRYGAELQGDVRLSSQWQLQGAYTYLHARLREGPNAGLRLPGLSQQQLFAQVHFRPHAAWRLALSAQHASRVYVNDANSEAAPGYTVAAASVGYTQPLGAWTLSAFARVDNLLDRQYVGSVIVNDGNGRYYESAPGRSWATGVTLRHDF